MNVVLRENTLQSSIRYEAGVVHMCRIPFGADTDVPVVLHCVRGETVENFLLVPTLFVEPLTHGLEHDLLDSSLEGQLDPSYGGDLSSQFPLAKSGWCKHSKTGSVTCRVSIPGLSQA